MDIVNRYLSEIRRNLPRDAHADDIIAEIGDDLQSQIEDGGDEVEVVRAYGNPYVVAARYSTHQSLIGPTLYPFFWRTYGALLSGVLFFEIMMGIARSRPGFVSPFFNSADIAFNTVVWLFAIVVVVFMLVERSGRNTVAALLSHWNPLRLPKADDRFSVPRIATGFEFLANAAMLYLMTEVLRSNPIFSAQQLALWHPALVGLGFAAATVMTGAFFVYIFPSGGRFRLIAHVVAYAIVIAGFGMTLHNGVPLVSIPGSIVALGIVAAALAAAFDARKLVTPGRHATQGTQLVL